MSSRKFGDQLRNKSPLSTPEPMTPEQLKALDAFVLEAFALDPAKDAGSVAADATMEDLIPGQVVTFKDVMESKKRQAIERTEAEEVFKKEENKWDREKRLRTWAKVRFRNKETQKGESTMIRRSEEERAKLSEFCVKHYQECTANEITDLINKEKLSKEPVDVGYVRYLLANAPKAAKNKAGKAQGAKRGRPASGSIKAREGVVKSDSDAGIKFDGAKLKFRLIWWGFVEAIVRVLMWGAKTYAPDNWKQVEDRRERYKEALLRHAIAYAKGETIDMGTPEKPGTGESHLACIGCNAMFLHWMDENGDEGK